MILVKESSCYECPEHGGFMRQYRAYARSIGLSSKDFSRKSFSLTETVDELITSMRLMPTLTDYEATMSIDKPAALVSSARETQARGETSTPGPVAFISLPPAKERWDAWTELDSQAWPRRKERHYASSHNLLQL